MDGSLLVELQSLRGELSLPLSDALQQLAADERQRSEAREKHEMSFAKAEERSAERAERRKERAKRKKEQTQRRRVDARSRKEKNKKKTKRIERRQEEERQEQKTSRDDSEDDEARVVMAAVSRGKEKEEFDVNNVDNEDEDDELMIDEEAVVIADPKAPNLSENTTTTTIASSSSASKSVVSPRSPNQTQTPTFVARPRRDTLRGSVVMGRKSSFADNAAKHTEDNRPQTLKDIAARGNRSNESNSYNNNNNASVSEEAVGFKGVNAEEVMKDEDDEDEKTEDITTTSDDSDSRLTQAVEAMNREIQAMSEDIQQQTYATTTTEVQQHTYATGESFDDSIEIIDENADDPNRKGNDILGVFRALGGKEAVVAAQAGNADGVQRAIAHKANETVSPRSRAMTYERLNESLLRLASKVQKKSTEKLSARDNGPDHFTDSRARLATALSARDLTSSNDESSSGQKSARDVQQKNSARERARPHIMSPRAPELARQKTEYMSDELVEASGRIQEILRLRSMTNDGSEMPPQPDEGLQELARKTRLINNLLELLKEEERIQKENEQEAAGN